MQEQFQDLFDKLNCLFTAIPPYGVIYKINFPNGKVYIGQTTGRVSKRFNGHKSCAFNPRGKTYNSLLSLAMRKYGTEALTITVIDHSYSLYCLNNKETFYIQYFNSYGNNGYNLTYGGEGTVGRKLSDVTKAKLSKANMGKTPSKETRARLSKANMGKVVPTEVRLKISKANKGRVYPKSYGENISKIKKGLKPMLKQISINGVIYKSVKDAAIELNTTMSSIYHKISRKTSGYFYTGVKLRQ